MVFFQIGKSQIVSLILVYSLCYLPSIKSQNISKNTTEFSNFKQTLIEYNNTKLHLDDISKKMENITLNIFLRARLREIIRIHKNIEYQISGIQKTINSGVYDKKKITEEISSLNHQMHIFERKYNKTNKLYYETEEVKKSLVHYIKVFFITLIIISIIVIAIIGIVSIFVIKQQKKYHKLQEENSFNSEERQIDGREITTEQDLNNFNSKEKHFVKKVEIKRSENELSSKDVFNKENVKNENI